MAAFSAAISVRVGPRNSEWSMETVVSMHRSASTILVASNLPPIPVSMMARSTPERLNESMATRKVVSKYVGEIIGGCSEAFLTISRRRLKDSGAIGLPSILILSSTVIKCGDVNSPVTLPLEEEAADNFTQRDPFPLVPAT